MALSNMLREPRREITETLVGLAVVGGFLVGDYKFARCFQAAVGDPSPALIIVGMLLGFEIFALGLLCIFVAHKIGDSICNALQARGIHLRPRNRR